MDLFWIIYLIDTISDGDFFPHFLWGVFPVMFVFAIGCAFYMDVCKGSWEGVGNFVNKYKYKYITVMSIWLLITSLGQLVPSKDTAYKMLAAYGVTEAYAAAQESDKVQAIAGKSLKVLEKALDDYLGKDGES